MGIHTETNIEDLVQLDPNNIDEIKLAARKDFEKKFNYVIGNDTQIDTYEHTLVYELICKVTLLSKHKK